MVDQPNSLETRMTSTPNSCYVILEASDSDPTSPWGKVIKLNLGIVKVTLELQRPLQYDS